MNPIKNFTQTWACQNCSSCFSNISCINASAFGYDKRKFLLVSKGYRQKQTEAMRKGAEMHEQLAQQYPKLDMDNIRNNILKGNKVILSEQAFCNNYCGFRGHPDLVELQLVDGKMGIRITDYKTSFWPTQLFQICVYGLIFSSKNCKIIVEEDGRKKTLSLYPNSHFTVDIELVLDIKKLGKKIYKDFMLNGELTQWGSNYRWAVMKIASEFRKLKKAGVYWVEQLPFCLGCRKKVESCSFWRICSKSMPSEPEKYQQKKFGRRKLLVKG